jgi:hypothetical protein
MIERRTHAKIPHSVLNELCELFHRRHPDPCADVTLLQQQNEHIECRIFELEIGTAARNTMATYLVVEASSTHLRDNYFTGYIPNIR